MRASVMEKTAGKRPSQYKATFSKRLVTQVRNIKVRSVTRDRGNAGRVGLVGAVRENLRWPSNVRGAAAVGMPAIWSEPAGRTLSRATDGNCRRHAALGMAILRDCRWQR